MKLRIFQHYFNILFFALVILFLPHTLRAKTISVPTDSPSIQSAINQAVSGDIVQVMPRTESYEENITLKEGITLEGIETARTIIDGKGSGVVITAAKNTSIQNLTITGGITGISANNISNLTLSNNIIVDNTTGINCLNASITINQNTIDSNDTNGISCLSAQTVSITNNLITNNGTGINLSAITTLTISNNGFYANTENGAEGTNPIKSGDPLFVNPLKNDYHLKSSSPSSYRGNDLADTEDDLGAYGGSEADLNPFQILGLTLAPGTDSLNLSFAPNEAYNIVGYRIYINKNKGIHENPEETDTTICNNNQCIFTLSDLDTSVTPPEAPTLQAAITGDQKLFLNWLPPNNQDTISSYRVFWGTASADYSEPASPIDVGNITAYTLLNLTNDISYFVAVKALAQARFFVSVTAITGASPVQESGFFEDQEVIFTTTPALESPFSNEVQEFPEEVIGFPNLPDEGGCFIATVAFGSILEPHVQILRAFRDHYLLPSTLGRRFVSFYYHYGPSWAHFIQQHPYLKPLVRVLLLPFVGLSYFFLTASIVQKIGVLLVFFMLFILMANIRAKHAKASAF